MVEKNQAETGFGEFSDASEKCLSLARLLRRSGRRADADVLVGGAKLFSQISSSVPRAELAKRVLRQSFGEDGPRLPSLVRGIIDLSQYGGDLSISSKEEVPSGISGCCDTPHMMRVGNIKCVLDGGSDKYLATINKLGSRWINNYSKPPFYFGRYGDSRFSSFSPYYKAQQIIAEAFFMQDEGALLLPDLSAVYIYSVGEYRCIKTLYESRLYLFMEHFLKHAGQLIYKIRHLDEIQPADYSNTTGLKKFKEIINTITMEYREVIGRQITTDELVEVALREHVDLLSL